MNKPLIQAQNLKKDFISKKKVLKAVDDVSFEIYQGKTLGLVGESGCGKSTLGKLILHLIQPTSGELFFEGKNILMLTKKEKKHLKKRMQVVLQNPYSSLNPLMTIEELIKEPILIHKTIEASKFNYHLNTLLDLVALPRSCLKKYPHEFSGGQRQRISIARALSCKPDFLVLDEPISALDVSIQAQILNLLLDLQKELNLTYLFISHNLAAVKYISNDIAVMYLGKIVETGPTDKIYKAPLHPYTKALISSIPPSNPLSKKKLSVLQGEVPSLFNSPKGCPFSSRCPVVKSICFEKKPSLKKSCCSNQKVSCHLFKSQD